MGKLAVDVRNATYHAILPELDNVQRSIVEKLQELGSVGATRHELAIALNRPLSSMCARVHELEEAQIVVETGGTRETQYGKPATVIRLAPRLCGSKLIQQDLF